MVELIYWQPENIDGPMYETIIPLDFLVPRLEKYILEETKTNSNLKRKYNRIAEALDSGADPLEFDPITLCYFMDKDEFAVSNGLTRITVFRDRNIPGIVSFLNVYSTSDYTEFSRKMDENPSTKAGY